jgi:hypothetical protein
MRLLIIGVLAALLFASYSQATTFNSDGTQTNIQSLHDNSSCHDGDTITVPSGTFSWTSTLAITKAIIIQGNTTTNVVTGTAVDNTIIQDNIVRSSGNGLIHLSGSGGHRITGLSFVQGLTTYGANGLIRVEPGSTTPSRFDHLHFNHVYQAPMIGVFTANYGVLDHCLMDNPIGNEGIVHVYMYDVNGGTRGDGAFTQPAGWGNANFFFIETNYLYGGADTQRGTRLVVRYNKFFDSNIASHGTATSFEDYRGPRAIELYNNEWHSTVAWSMDGCNGGTYLAHDNTFPDIKPGGIALDYYRLIFSYGPTFAGADGANVWDYNVTESDGVTHINGHSPYLFASGTLTSGTSTTITDSTKSWTTNQWANYSVRRTSDGATAAISSNTSTTLTIQQWHDQTWVAGNSYEIHKVLSALDQPGLGQVTTFNRASPAWPNQAIEPCYSWNNVAADTSHVNYTVTAAAPIIILNVHYFNDTALSGYTPYTYPHPLVGGAATTGGGFTPFVTWRTFAGPFDRFAAALPAFAPLRRGKQKKLFARAGEKTER